MATEEYTGDDIKSHAQMQWGKAFQHLPRMSAVLSARGTLGDRGEEVPQKKLP